jgi:hypothetical protein
MFQFPGFALNPLCIQELSTFCWISASPKTALPTCIDLLSKTAHATKSRLTFPSGSTCAVKPERSARLFGVTEIEGGFPHSEIFGSKPVRSSPKLIAAYHVLHRLSAPRHPPDTLKTLDCSHNRKAGLDDQPLNLFEKTILLQTYPGTPRSSREHLRIGSSQRGLRHQASSENLAVPPQPTPRPFDQICFLFTMSDKSRSPLRGAAPAESVTPPERSPFRQSPKLRFSGSPLGFKLILLHRTALGRERFSRTDRLVEGIGGRDCFKALRTRSFNRTGGARRDRTDDLMLAKHALSQLSYGP